MTAVAISGAFLQLVGILLLAYPDLAPWAVRLEDWLRVRARRMDGRVRRLFRRPGRAVEAHAELTLGAIGISGSAGEVTATTAGTLDEKVAWLLRRDLEAQRGMTKLAARLSELEHELPRRLATLSGELKGHVTDRVAAAQADYRTTRNLRALALLLGLGLSTWATLL